MSPAAANPETANPEAFPRPGPRGRARGPLRLAGLEALSLRTRPVTWAHERVLAVPGPVGAALPAGGVARGAVVAVEGEPGAGSTSVLLALAAAATGAGEWAAFVDLEGTLGGLAAVEAGIAPERFAVVRSVSPGRWAGVVAALLDGVGVVVTALPRGVRFGDARRLAARARERAAVLAVHGSWPAGSVLRLRAAGPAGVVVSGRGAPAGQPAAAAAAAG